MKKIKQGLDFYKDIRSKSMKIVEKEISLLDDFHAMVKVHWCYAYLKDTRKGSIDFHIFYFVTAIHNEIKIFGYIAGDEQKALKENGLIQEMELTGHQ